VIAGYNRDERSRSATIDRSSRSRRLVRHAVMTRNLGYWITTSIVALVLLGGGVASVAMLHDNVAGMARLGYPPYMLAILGVWKLLGGIVLLAPKLPRLKEWAYAGTIFDLTGAVVSNAVAGMGVAHVASPLVFAAIALASWALRPATRRLA
jgi:DoxX-like family